MTSLETSLLCNTVFSYFRLCTKKRITVCKGVNGYGGSPNERPYQLSPRAGCDNNTLTLISFLLPLFFLTTYPPPPLLKEERGRSMQTCIREFLLSVFVFGTCIVERSTTTCVLLVHCTTFPQQDLQTLVMDKRRRVVKRCTTNFV